MHLILLKSKRICLFSKYVSDTSCVWCIVYASGIASLTAYYTGIARLQKCGQVKFAQFSAIERCARARCTCQ